MATYSFCLSAGPALTTYKVAEKCCIYKVHASCILYRVHALDSISQLYFSEDFCLSTCTYSAFLGTFFAKLLAFPNFAYKLCLTVMPELVMVFQSCLQV